jgi:hypothetical protein
MTRKCNEQAISMRSLQAQVQSLDEQQMQLHLVVDKEREKASQAADVSGNLERMYTALQQQASADKGSLEVRARRVYSCWREETDAGGTNKFQGAVVTTAEKAWCCGLPEPWGRVHAVGIVGLMRLQLPHLLLLRLSFRAVSPKLSNAFCTNHGTRDLHHEWISRYSERSVPQRSACEQSSG